MKEINYNKILFVVSLALFLTVSFYSYNSLFKNKDFIMELEGSCNPLIENCFVRDCSEGDCPPNNLEIYKQISVPAYFFEKCAENSCHQECKENPDMCTVTYCEPGEDVLCSQE